MMKKIKTVALLALTFVFFVTGCNKEETIKSTILNPADEQSIVMKSDGAPVVNPFDVYHGNLEEMYQAILDFINTIGDHPEYEDFEIFKNAFLALMAQYQNPYQIFDISIYSRGEQKNIENLLNDYSYYIENFGLEEASARIEVAISLMPDRKLQQDLYSVVSQAKFMLDILDNFEDSFFMQRKPSWDHRVINCMGCKVAQLDNWVDWVFFVAFMPSTYAWWLSSCHWDATFRSGLHHTPC